MKQMIQFFMMQCIIAYRSKTALFWSFLYPLAMLVLMLSVFGGSHDSSVAGPDPRLMNLTGVMVITIMSGGIFALTTVLSADFNSGVYKRLRLTHLTKFNVIGALMLRQLVIISLGVVLVIIGAMGLFQVYPQGNLAVVIGLIVLGSVLFCAIGILIANQCQRPPTAVAIANAIFLVMLFLSGSTFPKTFFPEWLSNISLLLPASYLFDLLESQIFYAESVADHLGKLLILSLMALTLLWLSIKTFKWE